MVVYFADDTVRNLFFSLWLPKCSSRLVVNFVVERVWYEYTTACFKYLVTLCLKVKKSTDVLILMSHVSCTSLYLCCIGHYLYQIKTSESERALLPSVFAHTRNLSWC